MVITNATKQLKRMKIDMSHTADEYNAIKTGIKSLNEWNELYEECGRVAIKNREDLFDLIERHIKRIEG